MTVLNEDQLLFAQTSQRFLESNFPVGWLRGPSGQDVAFGDALWSQAAELGWTAMLVPESAGGGSVSGNGLADLAVIAGLVGRHVAPGPLIGTNLVASVLGRWSADVHADQLGALISGAATAAWAHSGTLEQIDTADGPVLNGTVGAVEAVGVQYVLVAAANAEQTSTYLLPIDSLRIAPQRGVDLSRRFGLVTISDVPAAAHLVGVPGAAAEHDAHLRVLVLVLAAAEITGTLSRAFDMTFEWVNDRFSFGRPLGSYQEIKHRVADLRTVLEAAEAAVARAVAAVGTDSPDGRERALAAMAYISRHVPEAIQDCVQIHGGIGVTFEHDLHLFLRRATLNANLYGTYHDFTRQLGELISQEVGNRG